ncbi:MAG: glycosyltransferase [Oscillospiraceae bacterium]|nr:glycosyltransferase [Oscillospiraceae bacterium]
MKQAVNILMCLMKLDIGGAETHVAELSKELSARGYNVVVASNGGVYEKELGEAGIKHYKVPLQNKNPVNVIKSFKMLGNIIRKENITLVHSHARIPSFILGKLRKKMGFPFVTTAHWVFTTKYGLKYITDWGQKTIAVSEDIKTYLIDNYNIPEKDIFVTINGIDTKKFSKDTPSGGIKKEFGIKSSDRVIVYVSRMDKSRSAVAKQLIEITEELCGRIECLRIIIAGDGDDFENVSAMAKGVNEKLGREVISLAGARVDVNNIIAAGELFVGVSRAALEAMSCEKPVIIAGNEGYIGLFEENKLGIAKRTNFCCRGCEMSDNKKLFDDIVRFFEMNYERKKEIADFSRKLILSEYSVSRMADDALRAYGALTKIP